MSTLSWKHRLISDSVNPFGPADVNNIPVVPDSFIPIQYEPTIPSLAPGTPPPNGTFVFQFYSVHGDADGDRFGPQSPPSNNTVIVHVPHDSTASIEVTFWYIETGGCDCPPPPSPTRCGFTAFNFALGQDLTFSPIADVTPASALQGADVFTDGPTVPARVHTLHVDLVQTHGTPPKVPVHTMGLI